MSNVRLHPDAFVPVGDVVTIQGEEAGDFDTGSIDVSSASGIIAQITAGDYMYFSFVEAVTNSGLLLSSANPRPTLLWFDPVQVPTIYYSIYDDDTVLRYQLIRPAQGREG